MNKQGNSANLSGGIEWTHFFGPGTGYTANPIRGCKHECRWRMPDGAVAICYAEGIANRLAQRAYPQGFAHISFHPEELDEIAALKQPAGIFVDSMSDLFGQGVEEEWITQILAFMWLHPRHVFFALTKNPTRLSKIHNLPPNLFLGVSLPPTFMFGKELTPAQQQAWFDKALTCLGECNVPVRWVSLEPLSWDCSDLLAKHRAKLHWAVIGAASNGKKYHLPDRAIFECALKALAGLPVFYKGNLRGLPTVWREEFPKWPTVPEQWENEFAGLPCV